MPKNEPRLCGLVRWHAKKSDACARAIEVSLSLDLQRRFGRVQGVFAAPMAVKQADTVVAHLEDAFTRGALEAERRRGPSAPQETLFEDAVAVTNQAVTRLFGENGVNLDPRSATGALMAMRGHDITVAVWGTPELLLYRFDREGRAKIFNLLSDEAEAPKDRTGFTNVITGRLELGDRLICSTRSVRDIIGPERLDHSMRLDPGGAIDRLRDELAAADDGAAVAILVADVAETRYVEEATGRDHGAQQSARELEQNANVTQEILSPSLMATVAGAAKAAAGTVVGSAASAAAGLAAAAAEKVKAAREEAARQAAAQAQQAAEEAKKPKWLRPGDRIVGESTVEVGGETFCIPMVELEEVEHDVTALAAAERQKTKVQWSGRQVAEAAPEEARAETPETAPPTVTLEMMRASLAQATAAPAAPTAPAAEPDLLLDNEPLPSPDRAPAKLLPSHLKDSTAAIINGVRRQSLTRKIGAGAVLIVIALTSVLVIINREMKIKEAERQNNERLLQTFNQKLDSAEASLIYKDTARAGELLNEAAAALNGYQPANEQETKLRSEYVSKLQERQAAIRHEVALGEPKSTVSAANAKGADAELACLARTNGIQWFVAASGQVYRQKAGESAPSAVAKLAGTPRAAFGLDDGRLVVVGSQGQTLTVKADGATAAGAAQADLAVTDAVAWNGSLYVLDAAHNRITRLAAAGKGWGSPTAYLKDTTDVSRGTSLAIDGSVYVLAADGTVTKLFKGLKTSFAIGGFDPAALGAARLRVTADRLYVLEPSAGRLLAFAKKDGAFIAQYKADALKTAVDFDVDVKAKVLTVVAGSQALKYALPQ